MFRHDINPGPEKDEKGSIDFRRDDTNGIVVHFGDGEVFPVDAKLVDGHVDDVGVVNDVVPGEDDVVGIEWMAIAPAEAFAQAEGPGLVVRFH
jgi:hypothetical protein